MNDRKQTPLSYRILRWFVWLFSPKFRTSGLENLPDGPCVIVGNHSQMYGPIAAEIFMPGRHDIWCAGEMMHREDVAEYAYRDFWSGKPRSVRWLYRLLSRVIAPLSLLVFNNSHTIAVYRDARLISTYQRSIDALQNGRSIVIFPECYDRHNNIVCAFQDKFVDLARFYYKKTGTELCFVPLYVAPRLKTMYFGRPVRFDAGSPIRRERARICTALMDAITAMAVSLPEHTVVPYPNISKRKYPKNIPLEVYDETTTV